MADAEKMHRCGLELNELARKILSHCRDDGLREQGLEKYQEEYAYLLKAYDNHAPVDFRMVQCRLRDEYKDLSWWFRVWTSAVFWFSILWVVLVALALSSLIGIITFCR